MRKYSLQYINQNALQAYDNDGPMVSRLRLSLIDRMSPLSR